MLCKKKKKKVSYNSCPIIGHDLQKNVIYQLLRAKNPMLLVTEMGGANSFSTLWTH